MELARRRAAISIALSCVACVGAPELVGKRCDSDGTCPNGLVCSSEGTCIRSGDLPLMSDAGPAAQDGGPSDGAIGHCSSPSDCTTPDVCQVADGASCVEGQCVYRPLACSDPPPPECIDEDATLRSYASLGTCSTATGRCEYVHVDNTCQG